MKRFFKLACLFSLVLGAVFLSGRASSQPPSPGERGVTAAVVQSAQPTAEAMVDGPPAATDASGSSSESGGLRPFNDVIDGFQRLEGLFTVYQDLEKNQAYLAVKPPQLNQNFLLLTTLESGLGEVGLFRGWPVSDFLVQFRRTPGNKLQMVVPNLNFRATPGQEREQRRLNQSFSDSPISTLNIVSIDDKSGVLLVDLGALVLTRDPANLVAQYPWVFGSYTPNPDASYLEAIKAFPQNIEASAVLGFSGSSSADPLAAFFSAYLESLPDTRGFSLRLRYSLSQLPENPSYQPRLADERVGYFLTAFRAPDSLRNDTPFVRYIQRWHLEKQDPAADLSPPKKQIVFWLENTVPPAYRSTLESGILLWNQAFEKAGFKDAIAVRQMPDDADWDPADVRYNVIRWSDSFGSGVLGYGPSRANPLTGEILDADVVLDANVIAYLRQEYQELAAPVANRSVQASQADAFLPVCGSQVQRLYQQWQQMQAQGRSGRPNSAVAEAPSAAAMGLPDPADRCASLQAAQQVAFGGLALEMLSEPFAAESDLDTYIGQYLTSLVAHEVGHVLGLRHNFLGSTLLDPQELNNVELTRRQGLVGSVMDYYPPNLAPAGTPQGEYFPTRLGPYDEWAIEYGYTPVQGPLSRFDQRGLQEIAQQGATPELAYATDEDIFDFLNPKAAAWDLSRDPLQYAQWQMDNAKTIWEKLSWYSVRPGEGYGKLRRRFDLALNYYLSQAMTIANYIGGQQFIRTDPWSSRGQPPLQPIPAQQQRQALDVLEKYVFSTENFDFSPDLLSYLAPDRWNHWGQGLTLYPLDYPIYDRILFIQGMSLNNVMFADRLRRLRDGELRADPDATLALPELFERIGGMVWSDVMAESDQPLVLSSLRRGLQRHHLNLLTNLVLRRGFSDLEDAQDLLEFVGLLSTAGAPDDARVLARYQLQTLEGAISNALNRSGSDLELATKAHLEDVRDRILKTLNAPLQSS